jgi:hypothetical protein
MQYKKLGLMWFLKVGALRHLSVKVDNNVARSSTFHIAGPLPTSVHYQYINNEYFRFSSINH